MCTALWLLLYASAGLLAHSTLGHNHWHGPISLSPVAASAAPGGHGHSHCGHSDDCPFHRHQSHLAGHAQRQPITLAIQLVRTNMTATIIRTMIIPIMKISPAASCLEASVPRLRLFWKKLAG